MKEGINFNILVDALSNCCLGKTTCGKCENEKCLIGYCKKSIVTSLKENKTVIEENLTQIPFSDFKIFDEVSTKEAIAAILSECKNCDLKHDEDCIINLLRSACEVIVFGNFQEYNGNPISYIKNISKTNKVAATQIYDLYLKYKS